MTGEDFSFYQREVEGCFYPGPSPPVPNR